MTKKKKTIQTISPPTTAIVDADIIAYRCALQAEVGDPARIPYIIEEMLEFWLPADTEEFWMALSCKRAENFRREIWPNYKKNRETKPEPELLIEVRDYIKDVYCWMQYPKIEADDIMGMHAQDSIAITIDKDLRGVSGWHYNPFKEDCPMYIDEEEAEEFFCIQWMTGDNTDCIPGLWRIGPKRAKSFLKKWGIEDRHKHIFELYCTDRYRPKDTCDLDDLSLALAMARCVRILSKGTYDIEKEEIHLWEPIGGV
jgi:DNA polymerase-1